MLTNEQIAYLTKLSDFEDKLVDGKVIGFIPRTSKPIQVPYEDFKAGMGLDDIRFHWMLGKANCLAGGSVLAWVTSQPNTGDYDLFFYDKNAADGFERFITSYGFKTSNETQYALTLFNYDELVKLQIVGGGTRSVYWDGMLDGTRRLFGLPDEVIAGFDIGLCKLAVSASSVYTTTETIRDLITKTIRIAHKTPGIERRMVKYAVKGYHIPGSELKYDDTYNNPFPYTSTW
jgi:hypothetical protein